MHTHNSFENVSCESGIYCLHTVAKYYSSRGGYSTFNNGDRRYSFTSVVDLSKEAERLGFRTRVIRLDISVLENLDMPLILQRKDGVFITLKKVAAEKCFLFDPMTGGDIVWDLKKLKESISGSILSLKPSPTFYQKTERRLKSLDWSYLLRYIYDYKRMLIQLACLMIVGSVFQLLAPFLTQSIVDIGVNTNNLDFIHLILIAQMMLFLGNTSVDFLRSWILLHITTRININLLTDFLIKLMKLPISYFDNRMTGEIMQRMSDQGRIQSFLTGSSVEIIFSIFNFLIFSVVLISYNLPVFFIFILSSSVYLGWIFLFLKQRRRLDDQNFEISAKSQSRTIELILGMKDIKLNNCQDEKRWQWERIQARLFELKVSSLKLEQYQHSGAFFINNIKNIIITFLSAKAVLNGDLTLGGMMAIQYVIGQMNGPVENFLTFIQGFQDARISLNRLNEIHSLEDEEDDDKLTMNVMPENKTLSIQGLNFGYAGNHRVNVLNDINLTFLEGKTTAIVGMSGSGKTTLLKMILRFYKSNGGAIKVGASRLEDLMHSLWRAQCGIVMQEGFIFSDTIARNIAVGDENIDYKKLENAICIANLNDFIGGLANGLDTKIGSDGNGISQGQRQRILIARAVYKDPKYILFDEATNSLDTNNEKVIMDNLNNFFVNRTVIIVAHRLSTVYNADNIIVMARGKIVEQGTHAELIKLKSEYYSLIQNQLELDS